MKDPLFPYQYRLIFTILTQDGMTAAHLSRWMNLGVCESSPQSVAGSLRPLVKRGWLRRDDGVYTVTARARKAVCW